MFSYTRIILDNTELTVYKRGLEYANKEKVNLVSESNNSCNAIVSGSIVYEVWLGFSRVGSPKYSCTCPYFSEHKKIVCKHIIAAALLWDRERSVPDPDKETIENLCIPEPTFTQKDINEAFRKPLIADLDIIRISADESGWMRPHAKLPLKPEISDKSDITVNDIKQGILELRTWTRRYKYDYYFCAGEMVAGFCELMRALKNQFDNFSLENKLQSLKILANFHHELILERIDDSDGLHIFTEAHLYELIEILNKSHRLNENEQGKLEEIIKRIEDY